MFKEKLQAIRSDDDAVSPVIGVILMVAVTVVLAAVIGAFVFGMGDSLNQPAPDAQINFDYTSSGEVLEVSHDGGQTISADNTGNLTLAGTYTDGTDDYDFFGSSPVDDPASASVTWDGSVSATDGDATVSDSGSISAGTTIVTVDADESTDSLVNAELVWSSPDGGNSQVIGTWTAP